MTAHYFVKRDADVIVERQMAVIDSDQEVATPPGYEEVTAEEYASGLQEPAPTRLLSPLDFCRRFTLQEDAAIDDLAQTNGILRAFMRRLSLASTVNLDHQDVISGLALIKAIGVPSVWPDIATADARIAEIRG
jgi:hypothetical protein